MRIEHACRDHGGQRHGDRFDDKPADHRLRPRKHFTQRRQREREAHQYDHATKHIGGIERQHRERGREKVSNNTEYHQPERH
jgi:hypothetical protein